MATGWPSPIGDLDLDLERAGFNCFLGDWDRDVTPVSLEPVFKFFEFETGLGEGLRREFFCGMLEENSSGASSLSESSARGGCKVALLVLAIFIFYF